MNMKKMVAGAATAGVLGFASLALGAGSAQADRPGGPCPGVGPGTNFAGPGTPHPPGQDCLPPPGHLAPGPDADDFRVPVPDRDDFDMAPWWVLTPPAPPVWAPPPPAPPFWAPWLPVIWNPDLGVWGVWQGGAFIQL
jgi:hypothetical protein